MAQERNVTILIHMSWDGRTLTRWRYRGHGFPHQVILNYSPTAGRRTGGHAHVQDGRAAGVRAHPT